MIWLGFVVGRAVRLDARSRASSPARSSRSPARRSSPRRSTSRASAAGCASSWSAILIVEDLIAILLMAVLTAVVDGRGPVGAARSRVDRRPARARSWSGWSSVGLLVVPRADARDRRGSSRPETTLVASIGICFAVALLAQAFGYSVALGAFLAGSLVAESGEEKTIEHLVAAGARHVRRDLLRLGRHADRPGARRRALGWRSSCSPLVVDRRQGRRRRRSARSSPATARAPSVQAGHEPGADRRVLVHHRRARAVARRDAATFLYPVAVAVSAITTLTTPWLIRASGPVASFVDRTLPHAAADLRRALRQLARAAARRAAPATARRAIAPARAAAAARRARCSRALVDRHRGRSAASVAALRRGAARARRRRSRARWSSAAAVAARACRSASASCGVARRLGRDARRGARCPRGATASVDLAAAPRRALVVTLAARDRAARRRCRCVALDAAVPAAAVRGAIAARACCSSLLGVAFWRSADEPRRATCAPARR